VRAVSVSLNRQTAPWLTVCCIFFITTTCRNVCRLLLLFCFNQQFYRNIHIGVQLYLYIMLTQHSKSTFR
jgi:hypothetical protein